MLSVDPAELSESGAESCALGGLPELAEVEEPPVVEVEEAEFVEERMPKVGS